MDEFDDFGSDADALASIGWGTDEDYGYYGEQYSIALFVRIVYPQKNGHFRHRLEPLSDLYQSRSRACRLQQFTKC